MTRKVYFVNEQSRVFQIDNNDKLLIINCRKCILP